MSTRASITTDRGGVAGVLADVARRGITLQAHAGKLRFHPRSAMTPDLARRIKAHRQALLALLSDTTPPDATAVAPREAGSRVLSVVSVSEPPERSTASRALWSEDELAMLGRAGKTPADLPLLMDVKDAFAEFGATVTSVTRTYGRGSEARRLAGRLIREARRRDRGDAAAMRDVWAERLAACTIDGGLREDHAEQAALEELKALLPTRTNKRQHENHGRD